MPFNTTFAVGIVLGLTLVADGQEKRRPWTSPKPNFPAEYGHGLTKADADAGWISLFDGKTTFGWQGGKVVNGVLTGPATTTTVFGPGELRGDVVGAGMIRIGNSLMRVGNGALKLKSQTGAISIGKGVSVRRLVLRPMRPKPQLFGDSFDGWRILKHPRNPKAKALWAIKNGVVRVTGGPGALELQKSYGDFVLQLNVRTKKLSNGGLFFRAIPGDFMNGYEAQIFNACYDHDPAQPARYSTGAIDDRQLARRLVSRDGEWFTLTVIAHGPHIATWVNGYQQVDWIDKRKPDANPRKGLRIKPGTIQLQAHDPETDFEFRNIRIAEFVVGNRNQ